MRRLVAIVLVGSFFGVGYLEELTAQTPPSKADLPKFMDNIKSKDPKTRIDGCKGIGALGRLKKSYTLECAKPLREMLKKDDDAKVRAAAAGALGAIDPDEPDAVKSLISALKEDKDKAVRAAAAQGLGLMGRKAKEAIPALKEAAAEAKADGDKKTAKAIGTSLKSIQSQLKQ
jgi:HEAT repeat protein